MIPKNDKTLNALNPCISLRCAKRQLNLNNLVKIINFNLYDIKKDKIVNTVNVKVCEQQYIF